MLPADAIVRSPIVEEFGGDGSDRSPAAVVNGTDASGFPLVRSGSSDEGEVHIGQLFQR